MKVALVGEEKVGQWMAGLDENEDVNDGDDVQEVADDAGTR